MSLVKRIELLCDEHGTTFAGVERDCGLSNGSIRRWDTNTPSTDKLQKVADYFNVSLDYLQGRTDYRYIVSESKNLKDPSTDPDIELIQRAHNKMDTKQRKKMMDLLKLSFDDLFKEESDD